MSENQNPLQKHFRRPMIYIKLPSQGQFWPDNALELPVTGELPVFPMTTKDEITIRTPDALLNGNGVVDVIKSCIPNIKDPWKMPSIDVDATLIAIRIASYGNMMEVDTRCPHCDESNSYNVDLNNVVAGIKAPDYSHPLVEDSLTFKFRPQYYFEVNQSNLVSFEEQKLLNTIRDPSIDEEERAKQYADHMARLIDLNNLLYVNSTESITTTDGVVVTDQAFINEFYKNSSRQVVDKVKRELEKFSQVAAVKPMIVTCAECEKEFSVNITFDYSNFFA